MKELDVSGSLFAYFVAINCDHILLFGAKMELSRVGELSLAEHLQDARVTLHWLPCKCVVENKKKCVSGRVTR